MSTSETVPVPRPLADTKGAASKASSYLAVEIVLVGVLSLITLLLRYSFAVRSGLWRDEALFLFIVHSPSWGAMFDFLQHHESHPPLFYTIMRLWQSLFGFTENSALALVVLFGVILIPLLYHIGRRIFSPMVGLTAAFLATISASLAENAALVRPYSLLPLLCVLSVFFLWQSMSAAERHLRRSYWLLYILVTAAMLYTHNWAWLVLGGEWTAIGACLLFRFTAGNSARALLVEAVVAQVGILVLYAPWIPVFRYQAQHAGHGGAAVPKFLHTVSQFATILVPLPDDDSGFFLLALILAVGVGAYFRYRIRTTDPSSDSSSITLTNGVSTIASLRQSKKALAVLLFIIVPIAAFAAAMVLNTKSLLLLPRCMAMLTPCALLVIAQMMVRLPLRPFLRFSAVLGLGIGCIYTTLLVLTIPKSNARELAGLIAAKVQKNDLIVIAPEHLASSFNYYYKLPTEQIDFPGQGREEATQFDDWVKRCADRQTLERTWHRLDTAHYQNRRVWLILADGLFFVKTPNQDRLIAKHMLTTAVVGVVRASQIRQRLLELYGAPAQSYIPGNQRDSDEVLTAFLFDPATSNPQTKTVR